MNEKFKKIETDNNFTELGEEIKKVPSLEDDRSSIDSFFNNLNNKIDNIEDNQSLISVYETMCSEDSFMKDSLYNFFEKESFDFFEHYLDKLLSTSEGRDFMKKILEDRLDSKGYYNLEYYAPEFLKTHDSESEQDEYDNFQSLVIDKLFQAHPDDSLNFFSEYLLGLNKMTQRELYDRGIIKVDPDEPDDLDIGSDFSSKQSAYEDEILNSTFPIPVERKIFPFEGQLESQEIFDSDVLEIFPETTSAILKNFSNYGTEKEIDVISDYCVKDGYAYAHRDQIIDCFQSINPVSASVKTLDELKKSDNVLKKILFKNILYRIEFGKLGINKDGFEYLEKKFDLGSDNEKFNFAQRLTANGDLGLFKDEKLEKYVNVKDHLLTDEDIVHLQAKEFVYETLFIGQQDETPAERERREEILKQFKENYYNFYDDDFFKKTGVRFNNLSFHEQAWFLEYTLNNEKNKDKIYNFAKTYKENGVKAFLSMNQGEEMGEKIMTIGEKLKGKGADLIFKKYNVITSHIDSLAEDISENFSNQRDYDEREIKEITNNLLKRAQQVLVKYSEEAEKGDGSSYEKISQELRDISEQVILFSSVFKVASEDENLKLSEIKGVEIHRQSPEELKAEEIAEMERIYVANKQHWQHWPQELLDKALGEFRNDIKENNGRFYILEVNGHITSFSWFNDIGDDRTYCGYFNVRPEARGAKIGKALKQIAYQQEGQFKTLECYVYQEDEKLVDSYAADYGFKVEEENVDPTGTGKLFFKLYRPVQKREVA